MKRAIKYLIVFTFVISVVFSSSFHVFAYYPLIEVDSSDWVANTDYTYKAVYPERIDSNYAANDDLYRYSYLNGDTYFGCRNDIEYTVVKKVSVSIPGPPDFGYKYDDNDRYLVVQVDNTLFLFGGCEYCQFEVYQGVIYQYCLKESHQVLTTYCDYPYSSWYDDETLTWQVKKSDGLSPDNYIAVFNCGWYSYDLVTDFEIIYCNCDIGFYDSYSYDVGFTGSDLRSADTYSITSGYEGEIYLESPLYVNYGSVSVTLSEADMSRLSFGSHAWLFSDIGFIYSMQSQYTSFHYQMQLSAGGQTTKKNLFSYSHNCYVGDEVLNVGTDYIFDTFQFTDFNYDVSELDITFFFVFVSDGMHLFFPGSFEVVEFESYEDDLEHDEVLDAIGEATSSITDSVNNSSSSITNSITSAKVELSSEIAQALDDNFDRLLESDDPAPDLSIDTSKLDGEVEKEKELLDDIYATLDDKNKQYLQSLGYTSVDNLIEDKVNDLNNSALTASFDFVKSMFENVVSVTGVSTLVFFSLAFGFSMFLIGRRVS